ncbi:hypothetical protein BCR34DRAFT_390613 [Clohesyomyces aquaticus]|uniref:Leucine-rich repeat domain-containing protein n=1 Tax=Clohesyomyces aquaticus TaxID=1231657 RepID=A0A1Y1ZEE5_9PLEO|nr:hypothetical protein BCR34DRAFT_390613 [Clohesyomyces aquaticus]
MNLDYQEFPPLPSQKSPGRGSPAYCSSRDNDGPDAIPTEDISDIGASLNHLPVELILYILDYVSVCGREVFQRVLANLSRTNQRLHAIAENLLYNEYNSRIGDPYLLLRTLILNPRLSLKIKSVVMDYRRREYEYHVLTHADRQIIKSGFRALNIPSWKSWAVKCNDEGCDRQTLYAAILMHTPNLATLRVRDGDDEAPPWVGLLKQSIGGNPFGNLHVFSRLHTVRIKVNDLSLRNLLPLFRLSALRVLALESMVETGSTTTGQMLSNPHSDAETRKKAIPEQTSPLEELALSECFVDDSILTSMVAACKGLKKFSYHHSMAKWLFDTHDGYLWTLGARNIPRARLHYPSLTSALSRHSHSLESIAMDYNLCSTKEPTSDFGQIGDLQSCTKLAHVEAPLGVLTPLPADHDKDIISKLPKCTTALCIVIKPFSWLKDGKPALLHLADHAPEDLPSLREVRFDIQHPLFSRTSRWIDRNLKPHFPPEVKVTTRHTPMHTNGNRYACRSAEESSTESNESALEDPEDSEDSDSEYSEESE